MKKCAALAIVKAEKGKASKASNSHFVFTNKNGVAYNKFNKICLAELRSEGGVHALRFFINQHDGPQVREENRTFVKEHIEQLIRSPQFAGAVRNKKVFWENGMNMNCSLPLRQLFFLITLVRMSYEFDKKGYNEALRLLMDNGIPRFDAAIYAQYLYKTPEMDYWATMCYVGGHGVSNEALSFEALKVISRDVNAVFKELQPANTGGGFYGLYDHLKLIANGKPCIDFGKGKKKRGEGWATGIGVTEEELIANIKEIKEKYYV